jgi:hypothetical protein
MGKNFANFLNQAAFAIISTKELRQVQTPASLFSTIK